jgi:putative transposase
MSTPDRKALLDRDPGKLSIRGKCRLLGIARSGVYRTTPANDVDLALMQRIDELFMAWPFLGSRRLTLMLRADGLTVNRKWVQRLMRGMGIAALGPKPRTTKPAAGIKIFPYLLRDLVIDRPNQVWAADITYIPIGLGFLYLLAIIEWASRAVLAWRLSNTMDIAFCVDALDAALTRLAGPRSPIPTRAHSSPAPPSPAGWPAPASGSRWTVAAAGSITSSSNGCGGR